MIGKLKNVAGKSINSLLAPVNLKVGKLKRPFTDYRDYIPFEETITGAKEAGLSVGDYIDAKFNKPGATQETIDRMAALGVFKDKLDRICEIGPGSGRYLDKVLKISNPSYCEIYETAKEWEQWLVKTYNVIAHPSDGKSLAYTPSNSIDLIQAHKVISGQPSLWICQYFAEMARVVRDGGKVVFDMVTEDCLDDATLENWITSGHGYQHYPCLMPKQYTINFFERRGLVFDGSFFIPMEPGKTECFVFTKK
ncbi:MAG: methyltransferase domain-containing protein [Xenococcaceae cyanobacterium]